MGRGCFQAEAGAFADDGFLVKQIGDDGIQGFTGDGEGGQFGEYMGLTIGKPLKDGLGVGILLVRAETIGELAAAIVAPFATG